MWWRCPSLAAPTPVASSPDARGRVVPLSPMRKAIARNLAAAWQAPAFMLTRSVQMDAALSLRAQLNDGLAATGSDVKVSVNDEAAEARKLLAMVPVVSSKPPRGVVLATCCACTGDAATASAAARPSAVVVKLN